MIYLQLTYKSIELNHDATFLKQISHSAITCSKLTKETLETSFWCLYS